MTVRLIFGVRSPVDPSAFLWGMPKQVRGAP
jgi:hypothetical protein